MRLAFSCAVQVDCETVDWGLVRYGVVSPCGCLLEHFQFGLAPHVIPRSGADSEILRITWQDFVTGDA